MQSRGRDDVSDGRVQGANDTSIAHELWRALTRPAPLPPSWPRIAAAIAVVTAAGVAAAISWGHAHYGNPKKAFGEAAPGTILSVTILAAAGAVAARVASRVSAPSLERCWRLPAVLLVYLALDDLLLFHEGIDQGLHRLVGRDPSGSFTDHLDDLIVASYAGLFVAIWWREWRALADLTWTLRSLVAALVAYVAMVIYDVAEGGKVIEDSLKIAGGALILIAFAAAFHEEWIRTHAEHESRRRTG